MYVYIYRKRLRVRWTLLKCTNQIFSGLHVLTGIVSKINTLYKMILFLLPPLPTPLLNLSHNIMKYGGEWVLERLNKNKTAGSHTLSFLQTRKRERGGRKGFQNKVVTTSKSAHPAKFPSFLLSFFLSLPFLNLASKDKGSQEQYRLYLHNLKCQDVDVVLCT